MRIEVEEGCYGRSITVDGKRFQELTDKEHDVIIKKIIKKSIRELDTFNLVCHLLENLEAGSSEYDDDPCDQCGSYYYSHTYEV